MHSQQGYVMFQNLCITQTSEVWALRLNSSLTKPFKMAHAADWTLWQDASQPLKKKVQQEGLFFFQWIRCQSERRFPFDHFVSDFVHMCATLPSQRARTFLTCWRFILEHFYRNGEHVIIPGAINALCCCKSEVNASANVLPLLSDDMHQCNTSRLAGFLRELKSFCSHCKTFLSSTKNSLENHL